MSDKNTTEQRPSAPTVSQEAPNPQTEAPEPLGDATCCASFVAFASLVFDAVKEDFPEVVFEPMKIHDLDYVYIRHEGLGLTCFVLRAVYSMAERHASTLAARLSENRLRGIREYPLKDLSGWPDHRNLSKTCQQLASLFLHRYEDPTWQSEKFPLPLPNTLNALIQGLAGR